MDTFEIPIFKKSYELYKGLYGALKQFPKQDRYASGQKCELLLSDFLDLLFQAGALPKGEKLPCLEKASAKLNLFRMQLRLAKDIRALDQKKYLIFQIDVDEIGRMLGGWKKNIGDKTPART